MWQAFKLTTTFSHLEDSIRRCPVVLSEMQPVMENWKKDLSQQIIIESLPRSYYVNIWTHCSFEISQVDVSFKGLSDAENCCRTNWWRFTGKIGIHRVGKKHFPNDLPSHVTSNSEVSRNLYFLLTYNEESFSLCDFT